MAKELNKFVLSAIAIIGLTVVVLVGMAISANYSRVLRTDTTITNTNTTVTDTLELAGTTTVLSNHPFLQTLSGCMNSSDGTLLDAANYTISEGDKDGGGLTLIHGNWSGTTGLNCTDINYLAGTTAQASADKFTTGLATFGTFAVILILAIIGKAIVGLFRRKD